MDKTILEAHLSPAAAHNVWQWLTEPKFALYRDELEVLIAEQRWQELEDSFFQIVEFGTGGRRGTTGIGSNRINKVTIGESAQALCAYAKSFDAAAPEKGIVIACDTRISSPELSRFAAQVCAASGFKTYLFDSFRSTPELSFAVRHLGCAAGIVISASHNQPADNGFKAYWSDGGQLVAPHDKGVLDAAIAITEIESMPFDEAIAAGVIEIIGPAIDEQYIAAVVNEAEGSARDLHIVYSPLHGAGQTNTLPVLQAAGFSVSVVESQMVPDGNFPTIENGKPNPEEKVANARAAAQLMSEQADIAVTNDPDADRIGVIVRHNDELVYLTGNQSAALATEYVLSKMQAAGSLSPEHYIAKTIVTTDLLDAAAQWYNVHTYGNMLIGFKYISALITSKEHTPEQFVIGGEESYGLLKGTYARDKDGAVGALPLAEYAAELKLEGRTLFDGLLDMYRRYGVFRERLDNVMYPGADGFEKMAQIMQKIRSSPPLTIGDHTVTAVLDYKTLQRTDTASGEQTDIDCVAGNVVALEFGDRRRRITVRPSGTEPKLKLYAQWFVESDGDVEQQAIDLDFALEGTAKELEGFLLS